SGRLFVLTHNYTGYPMVRHAKALVEAGEIGVLRLVQVEYSQDCMAEIGTQANGGNRWRDDPARAGSAGTLGDIGTHAYQLAHYISGVLPTQLLAELHTFIPERRLDDHVQVMLRYANGARGTLWASQVATGCENTVRIRLCGDKASLLFDHENPNELWLTPQGGISQRLTRGRVSGRDAEHATRIPAGHSEGYLEAFAQLYRDAALQIHAVNAGLPIPEETRRLTTVEDGVIGMLFMEAALSSHAEDGKWIDVGR
ncbi:MAG: Gfo/Idh/MocA family oxidoreductase, partial [Glaciimonas sp.]|nr:Gfo/Idh/MocA family oxidoreductase [Glaciimonas sp.]